MRIYVPLTVTGLRSALAEGQVGSGHAYAVTPGLRTWVTPAGDVEELEFVALNEASRHCLRMLAELAATEPAVRVVLAAEVPDVQVVVTDENPGEVAVHGPVPIAAVASAHIDGRAATHAVAAAVQAVGLADAGDAGAETLVDAVDELLWYAVEELPSLAAGLTDAPTVAAETATR
jgi:hypothetical protein